MRPHPWLTPLVPLYTAAAHARNAGYDRGLISPSKLGAPVVSIGNLSTGGGGKTPFVIALAKLLTEAGIGVDVLSRGYGRNGDAVERVNAAAQSAAEQFGDEPLLIARSAAVPVYVGRSRYAAGVLAEQAAGDARPVHLLDDGFQHRQLARDLDIVLLHREDFRGRLLPAGNLREPLTSLRRAHVVVLRESDREIEASVQPYLGTSAALWHVERQLMVGPGGPAVAFCGIAHPEEFFAGLRELGVDVAATLPFPDHHRFSKADLDRLCYEATRLKAARFLTTEKDDARLSPAALARLQQCAPVNVAHLRLSLVEADAAVSLIRRL